MRALLGLLHLGDGIHPSLVQDLQLAVELGYALAFSYGSDDDTAVLGFDAVDELLESCSFFTAFDLGGYRDLVAKGQQDEIAAGKAQLARQARTLGGDRLLDNLHEHFLSLFERLLHAAVLLQVGQARGFVKGEEAPAVALYLLEILSVGIKLTT